MIWALTAGGVKGISRIEVKRETKLRNLVGDGKMEELSEKQVDSEKV